MSYYQNHVFICVNQRANNKVCCANGDAQNLLNYAKSKIKSLDLNGKGKIRINGSGCLDRCDEGPVLVIYPEGVWYHYQTKEDIDEIIQQHLVEGKKVQRLLLES
jgi:(2Fe-2S) ferredoxin